MLGGRTLGELKDEQLPGEAVVLHDLHTFLRKIGGGKGFPGEIAGEEEVLDALVGQLLKESAGGAQAVVVQLVDQTLPLQHGDKYIGEQQALFRVQPPGEGLAAHDAVPVCIHVELDVKLKLVVLQGVVHRQAEGLLGVDLLLGLIGEYPEILLGLIGAVGRLAGVEDHLLQIPVSGLERVDAGGDVDVKGLSAGLGVGPDLLQGGGDTFLGLLRGG